MDQKHREHINKRKNGSQERMVGKSPLHSTQLNNEIKKIMAFKRSLSNKCLLGCFWVHTELFVITYKEFCGLRPQAEVAQEKSISLFTIPCPRSVPFLCETRSLKNCNCFYINCPKARVMYTVMTVIVKASLCPGIMSYFLVTFKIYFKRPLGGILRGILTAISQIL